ncbi:MAG: cytochrome c3 family protein [Terriglobales bacterium]
MKFWIAYAALLLGASVLQAQFSGDVLGSHNMGPGGTGPLRGGALPPCQYCHAPHSGSSKGPLWAQTFSTQTYNLYHSSTDPTQTLQQPPIGAPSSLCLSCHDGTIAPGQTIPYGKIAMQGNMSASDILGTSLQNSHPFSFNKIKDQADLVSSLVAKGVTQDPLQKVTLINGNVECESCHNPHIQNGDAVSLNFLVRNSVGGAMCLACHGTTPRTVNSETNPLVYWPNSVHATISNAVLPAANVGPYVTVAQNACTSCHVEHNANGPARLLRGPTPAPANMDPYTQNCITCHNGNSNVAPSLANVYAEFSKVSAHPYPSGNSTHDTAEGILLNNNRHATCADCHNPHAAQQVTTFTPPPLIRPSQTGVNGISASDGITPISPAQNQYENCLRCHGTSTGKPRGSKFGYLPVRDVSNPADPNNVIAQFAATSSSSHPVTHTSNSPYPQPSLLPYMSQLNGVSQGRQMGTQIFCTDCHNSDDNREFGGLGPNGPHGSKYVHLLERRYEFSQAPGPGQRITNLLPNPDLTVNGPYAMCGKCHDLGGNIIQNTSWSQHSIHINAGFTCSTCHTAHGIAGRNGTVSGDRLVDFDLNIVAPNGSMPISYNGATGSCTLVCHEMAHSPNGKVVPAMARNGFSPKQ